VNIYYKLGINSLLLNEQRTVVVADKPESLKDPL